jgi:hypothetical protein
MVGIKLSAANDPGKVARGLSFAEIGGAAPLVAYGLRKLVSGYSGNCIEVRRDSDDNTDNIGFDARGNLDISALETFVGSGNTGTIKTWYDQSGSEKDLSQAGNLKQPTIVSSGSTLLHNGRPIIKFDGSNDLVKRSISDDAQPHTFFFVRRYDDIADGECGLDFSETNSADPSIGDIIDGTEIKMNFGNAITLSGGATDDTMFCTSAIVNGASSKVAVNGTLSATVNLGSNPVELVVLGRREGNVKGSNSQISIGELIVFSRAFDEHEFIAANQNIKHHFNLGF